MINHVFHTSDKQIQKRLKAVKKRNYDLEELRVTMKKIAEEETLLEERYRPHKLEPTKDYLDCWECHIGGRNSNWILIYKYYSSENIVSFMRTGTHADFF